MKCLIFSKKSTRKYGARSCKQLWERHGNLIVALALLVVLAVGGWRGYDWWETQKAAESGAAFEAAVALAEAGKQAEAQAAFAKLAKEGSSGYRVLARFREAAELAKTDPAAAVKAYDALAADSSLGRALQDLAAIRAGLILVDTAPLAELTARLEPLTAADRPFRHTARELLALGAWRAGDAAAAKRWFDLIATDVETPAGTRQRIDVLMTLSGDEGQDLKGSARCADSHRSLRSSAGLVLAGCNSFDPLDKFQDWDIMGVEEAAAGRAPPGVSGRRARACRRACRPTW